MENKCVVCGLEGDLNRHHVVPYCYRKFFPIEFKSHRSHDVLPLCIFCHESYEYHAFQFKKELAIRYSAPIDGERFNNKDIMRVKKMAVCLTSDWLKHLPKEKVKYMKTEIKNFFSWKRITTSRLEDLANKNLKVLNRTHGEVVISNIKDFKPFIKEWRQHFLDNNNCKYLPKNWSVDND